MPSMMAQRLYKRQAFSTADADDGSDYQNGYDGYDGDLSWWWTPAGIAVRYSIVAALFGGLLLFFVGGYLHARRRTKKGLPLLAYHRWMVRQPTYNYPPPRNTQYPHYDPNSSYPMDGYPPPPPAYGQAEAPPPTYQPPPGASKAMADQNFRETSRPGEASGSAGPAIPPQSQA